jgi:2-oxoglutarate ferredoxin oxidoreductase subunit beta
MSDFSGYTPTWCPGCGDWGIGAAIKNAFIQMGMNPSSLAVVFGIGCSGNMNDFLNAYALHSLHGRAISNANGIKIANHTLPVFVIAGDGDTYGEGGNHFLHACRGNHDLTCIIHDNGVYGLTTGQSAPTAQKGYKSRSTPDGIIEVPVNPLTLAISQGATFVAQAFAGNIPHLISMIKAGTEHKGFSLVNILQPCVTFNKVNTYAYYREKTYELEADYDNTNMYKALEKASEPTYNERFPLGVLYDVSRPTFTDSLPQIAEKSLVEKAKFDQIEALLDEYV